MKKVELLSPAGSYESAIAGIQNGCDAIYMAGTYFGARAFAANFDNEKINDIVHYAHAYGVKVYITLNTLIHDQECDKCFSYIDFLYQIKVDALIVQDLGILYYIRKHYPDFEVHASTQMHIVNESAIQFLKSIGVMRAVLAREVKLSEIQKFAKLGVDLEVFVHGALCVAYSGQCLMSSMIGGRSGNRGECAQPCRMPYTLCEFDTEKQYGKPAYLLSLKDLNTLDHIQALKEAGVASFKIEGRMKKSEYVGYITFLYRQMIDDSHFVISEDQLQNAKVLFHRGYTSGFLYERYGSELVNPKRPNHIGVSVGKVVGYQKNRVQVYLTHAISQGDGIRILNESKDYGFKINRIYVDGLLANHAEAKMMVEIECYEKIQKGSEIVKTSDPLLEKQIREGYEQIKRRVFIHMKVTASSKEKLKLEVSDGHHHLVLFSNSILEIANRHATLEEDIIRQLSKVKDTIFAIDTIKVEMQEALFIPIKIINQLRRDALEQLYDLRSRDIERMEHPYNEPVKNAILSASDVQLNAKVLNEAQLLTCLDNVDHVYVEDRELYTKYKAYENVKLCSSRIEKGSYDEVSMIQDIGGIHALNTFEADASLNVYNAYTLNFLTQMNASLITFSHELNKEDIVLLMQQYKKITSQTCNTQFVAYGRVKVMISEYCPINATLLDNNKNQCQLCRKQTYALKDKFNNYFLMNNDMQCRMHLYDYKITDRLHDIETVLKAGVNNVRLDFTFEKEAEILNVIKVAKQFMCCVNNQKGQNYDRKFQSL